MNSKTIKIATFLLIGAVFVYFSNGRYSFPLAAWLFPVFFLQVSRQEKSYYSYLIIPLLVGVACQASFWKFTYDNPSSILFYLPFILGIPMGLLFYVDRLFYLKSKGFPATLIFPLLYTCFDFSLNLFNPFGTLGVLGYSQYDFLAFSQLASITGMWGLTFMITWFGAVSYWVINNYNGKENIKRGIAIYSSILITILIYGSVRLNIPASDSTITIAGIHCQDKNVEGAKMNALLETNDTTKFKIYSDTIINRLIKEAIKQASAGAKIVLWSEISSKILKSKEDSLISLFKDLAREQQIYLIASPYTINANPNSKPENKVLVFSPKGEQVLSHYKYGGNFMEGTLQGDKIIKTVSSEYGKLSAIICWDGDFPSIVKQVGKLHTDILFIPASDWREIDPVHSYVAIFRGIENGCSIVRQTRNGLSIMADGRGKVVSQMDHFSTSTWVTVGQVPNVRWFTLYPIIGDVFGWLSYLFLILLIGKIGVRKGAKEKI